MPPLEEQFPLVNPLVLQRPEALDPPEEREREEDTQRIDNRDELPRPGTLADGIDRVTLSANARVVVPVQSTEETVSIPNERGLNVQTETPEAEVTNNGLQDFTNEIQENRVSNAETIPLNRSLTEQRTAPTVAPATPPAPNPEPATRAESSIENRVASEPATDTGLNENRSPVAPIDPFPTSPIDQIIPELEEEVPIENPLGLRGNTPEPLGRSVNILRPANVGDELPGPNLEEARNFGLGRTLTLNPDAIADERNIIALNTVEEVLEEAGAIPGPETNVETPIERLSTPAVQPGFVPGTDSLEDIQQEPAIVSDDLLETAVTATRRLNLQRDPEDIPGPAGANVAVSSLTDTREVFERDQEIQELQTPAFPELDPDEPFIANNEIEAQEEDVPAVAQPPLNIQPPEFENTTPVAPPLPSNVETLDENPQALRRNNLGTDPALRSNRAIRNFLEEFNNRIEPPEAVTESEGGPITEVQSNAPPPPPVFENLQAIREELLNKLRTPEGVTRPEEERTAPPEPLTSETLLTERGQNIDQFI